MGDFERIKEAASLHDFAEQNLTRARRGNEYVCPNCNSGGGKSGDSDSAFSITSDGEHWECFSCHAQGDIFDLAGIVWGIPEDNVRERLQAVADWANIDIDYKTPRGFKETWSARQATKSESTEADDYTEGRKLETEYIERTQADIEQPEAVSYLAARGFTVDDARTAGIGYDVNRRRLVLPWRGASWYHADRAIDENTDPKYLKPARNKVGSQPLYNPTAADQPAYFIVEGVLDAIAVQLSGYEAIAVASNDISERNLTELTEGITAGNGGGVAVIMLDNDDAGREGGEKVKGSLTAAGVACIFADVGDDQPKDAADWYKADRDGLRRFLGERYDQATRAADDLREQAYRDALSSFRVIEPADVARDIFTLTDFEEPISTGFDSLDRVLDGGLRSGLTSLGAVSSMGKTTFAVQVADYIAEHGHGVLFVTIEQSAREIVAKSLSRYTLTLNGERNVVSATEIVSASRRDYWREEQTEAFLRACEHYAGKVSPRLKILEGTRQPKVADVEAVARMIEAHDGQAPVIFIDYLQLLAASSDRDTDKQATDKNVMALRQLARDLRTPIFAISSLNRSSYSEGVTMDAWKESGAIEYGCDVLIGLQPQGIRETIDKARDARVKREAEKTIRKHKAGFERDCELVVLKNRNGATPEDGLPLVFKPLSALYVEGEQERQQPVQVVI